MQVGHTLVSSASYEHVYNAEWRASCTRDMPRLRPAFECRGQWRGRQRREFHPNLLIRPNFGGCGEKAYAPLTKDQVGCNLPERAVYVLACLQAECLNKATS